MRGFQRVFDPLAEAPTGTKHHAGSMTADVLMLSTGVVPGLIHEAVPSVWGTTGLSQITDELIPEGVSPLWALLGALTVLALLDSTSFGTLLIPVWLLMAPGRLRAGRVLVYLGIVAGAYALIGLVLLTSLLLVGDQLVEGLSLAQQTPVFLWAQAGLAALLILYSFRLDPMTKEGKEKKRRRDEARGSPGRVQQFRERAVGEGSRGGTLALLGLGLAAVGLEIATLLPYLAGIGLVAAEDPGPAPSVGLILYYCAVMITPALVLLTGRVLAGPLLQGPLQKLEHFLSRHASGTVALILFLVGLFLGLNALEGLS